MAAPGCATCHAYIIMMSASGLVWLMSEVGLADVSVGRSMVKAGQRRPWVKGPTGQSHDLTNGVGPQVSFKKKKKIGQSHGPTDRVGPQVSLNKNKRKGAARLLGSKSRGAARTSEPNSTKPAHSARKGLGLVCLPARSWLGRLGYSRQTHGFAGKLW